VGAKGYLLKDTADGELIEAIHAIQGGSHYFSEKFTGIAESYLSQKGNA
jgi:DNA-binding NarL/FixJ family response regulator